MAAFANVVINDGQGTPASHTFNPGKSYTDSQGRLVFQWNDFSVNSGVAIGANRIEMYVKMPVFGSSKRLRQAGDSAQTMKTDVLIVAPTLETLSNNTASGINPQPTWAFDTSARLSVTRNGRAGQQPVKDVLAFIRNFSQAAVYTDTVLNYAPPSN